jgi:hypothetical protein
MEASVNDIDSAGKLIAQVGLPIFLLLLCLYAVFKLAKLGAERLLGKDDGILTKLATKHMEFLQELSNTLKEATQLQHDLLRVADRLEKGQDALMQQLRDYVDSKEHADHDSRK